MARHIALAWLIVCLTAAVLVAQTKVPRLQSPLGIEPTAREVELGRALFFDSRLSADGTVSCSTCHDPAQGWSDGERVAIGIGGQRGTRNSPTVINASYSQMMFWDGRVTGSPAQSILPLVNPIEMGNTSQRQVVNRLRLIPGYVSTFAKVYGIDPVEGNPITSTNMARALAAFETTVLSFDAPIDRFLAGDEKALTPDAIIGYGIFVRSGCTACHPAPLYTDNDIHNNGMEFAGKFRVTDQGRFSVIDRRTATAKDVRGFKTPTLREIARTAPYNHAGNFDTLERVIQHYSAGGANFRGVRDRYTDPRVRRLDLSDAQRKYLELFLREGFTSASYPMIVAPEPIR